MSDNKTLLIITIAVLTATTLLFLAIVLPPYFFNKSTASKDTQTFSKNSVLSDANMQPMAKGVLGASVLHITRDVQLDGTALINGDLYIGNGSSIHIGNQDIKSLLSTHPASSSSQQITNIQESGVLSLQHENGDLVLTNGNGIAISGLTITNTDTGSSQHIFKTISANGNSFSAAANNDSLNFIGSNGITVSLGTNNNITISDTSLTNLAPYSFLFATGSSSLSSFSPGDSGLVLQSNGPNTLPSWVAPLTLNTISGLTNANLSGSAGITNANLANPSLSVLTGAGLSGGGTVSLGDTLTLTNSGVLSLLGIDNQINISTSSGNITLSLPQNINATASPTFQGITLSSTASTSGNLTFSSSSQLNILNGGNLGFYPSVGGDAGRSANPALFIANSGKIGIGTNNPGTNALQINGGSLYVNGNSNSIIADGIVRSNTLFWMSNGNNGVSSILRLENYSSNAAATGLSLSAKLAGTDGSETEWPYQTIIKDATWNSSTSTRNASVTFNTLFNNISKETLRLASSGLVGIGSSLPLATLDLRSQSGTLAIASISGKTSFSGLLIDNSGTGSLLTASNAGQTKFTIDNQGNTRITSSLCVKANFNSPCSGSTPGTIYATNQTIQNADYAENYISSQHLSPGDIVMPANDGNNNAIIKSSHSYQQETIGVVSTAPGVTLNSNAQIDIHHPYLYPIALSGRVPVTVSTENGVIHTGDFITTSSKPGIGMKATKEGVVIGKALEAFDGFHGSSGQILVYINVGWANPHVLLGSNDSLETASPTLSDATTIIPPLPTDISSLRSGISSLQTQVSSISSQLQHMNEFSSFISTSSATPFFTNSATLSGSLSVLGKSLFSNVGITDLLTDGLLTINGLDASSGTPSATINTLSTPLKLQSLGLAGLDILNGKITIDTEGNMHVQNTFTAKKYAIDTTTPETASAGKVIITKGKTTVDVSTQALTPDSLIFATPDTIPVAVAKKQIAPDRFELTIPQPLSQDLRIDWWVVN